MSIETITNLTAETLYTIIMVSAPLLLISLCVGLIISIFQTVTSIQEQTLTFVPKILAVFLGILIFGHWMLDEMTSFMIKLWSDFSIYIK